MKLMSLRLSTKVDLLLKPEKVYRAEKWGTKRALNKAGAFVRRRAMSNYLRRRARVSKPGQGPSVHTKHPYATLKNIRFALNSKETEVTIGPLKLDRLSHVKPVSTTVPGVLELGGQVVVRSKRVREGKPRKKLARIQKRPFMRPAFNDELPKFAEGFRGEIR